MGCTQAVFCSDHGEVVLMLQLTGILAFKLVSTILAKSMATMKNSLMDAMVPHFPFLLCAKGSFPLPFLLVPSISSCRLSWRCCL